METRSVASRWGISRVGSAPRLRVGAEHAVDLGALYDAYGGALYRYLLALLGSADEAEDALQEVFLGLLRRPHDVPIEQWRPYLFRAAHNQALGLLRRRQREEPLSETSWIDTGSGDFADREFAFDVDRAVRLLPREQREVIFLKLSEGLTFRQIASVLGIPQNTAASRYRLAIARLRQLLQGDDDGG